MRVMHVIAPGPYGGAESVVRALAASRRSLGETVVATLVPSGSGMFEKELEAAGVPVETITAPPRRYLLQARLLADRIRARGVVLVHTHIYHADFVGYHAARRAGRPVVATYHGHTGGDWRNRLYEWGDRQLLRRFDAVICVSGRNRDRLLQAGCRPERLHVVPNGLAPAEWFSRAEARARLALPQEGLAIGWVGRLSREKGPDLLLEALERVARPDVHTVFIGDGPERHALERGLADGRVRGHVHFAGAVPDAGRLLAAFDLLAISSRTEGLPMVLLEAAGAGTPIVAFAVGGIPEYLDEICAWLVPPGDTGAFARSLEAALARPEERQARALAAKAVVGSRLSAAAWVDGIEQVYVRVTAGRDGASRP
jgi:glycosyltransferase involved in cell wall biosynthesis